MKTKKFKESDFEFDFNNEGLDVFVHKNNPNLKSLLIWDEEGKAKVLDQHGDLVGFIKMN